MMNSKVCVNLRGGNVFNASTASRNVFLFIESLPPRWYSCRDRTTARLVIYKRFASIDLNQAKFKYISTVRAAMGTITLRVDDEVERSFRKATELRFGRGKGTLKKAYEE